MISALKNACAALGLACLALPATAAAAESAKPSYLAVDALFREHCLDCHAVNEPEGKLVLESFEALMKGGESGSSIVPGKAEESLLVKMIDGGLEKDGKKIMMPPGKRPKLTSEAIAAIKEWVNAGAPAPSAPAKPAELAVPRIQPSVPARRSIKALAYQPKTKLTAIARGSEVELLDSESRASRRVLGPHQGSVNAMSFSPDGKYLYTGAGEPGVSGEISQWNVESGALVRTISAHPDAIYSLAVSPDGKKIATGSYDQKIKLWHAESGEEIKTLSGHNGAVFDLAFRPDGKLLASASADRTVKLWDAEAGERRDTLSQSLREVHALAFSPDGKRLIAGGVDNRIRLWEISENGAETTNPLLESRFAHEGAILKLAWSPDGKTIASTADDRAAKLWNASDLKERMTLEKQPDWPSALAFTLDGKNVAVGRLDGTAQFYDTQNGQISRPPKPELARVSPRGVERGKDTRIKLLGKYLDSASEVKLHHEKLKGELLRDPAPQNGEAWLRISPAADLPRGSYEISVASTNGESARVKIHVDDLPQVEASAHSPAAHVVSQMPVSVWSGHEKSGEFEEYEFEAKAGQTLVFDSAAKSLGSKSDLFLSLVDESGRVLADNNAFDGTGDPFLAYTFETAGKYRVHARELLLGASSEHYYRLSIGELPCVTGVFPLSAQEKVETTVELIGHNLGSNTTARVTPDKAGEIEVPLSMDQFRFRKPFKLLVGALPEARESEPNNRPAEAQKITLPASIAGKIQEPGDTDLFQFEAKAGQTWIIETAAAERGSLMDSKIEVLWLDGQPVERLVLQAVRNSAITFRGIDSTTTDCRVENWEEMELNQLLYLQGEVVKLFRAPQGPDSGFQFYSSNGRRRNYFDTSATAHAVEEPCYIVEAAPAGTKPAPNGLPAFPVHFANDDDSDRKTGTDSRVFFTAPKDGSYLARVTDSRHSGGERWTYRLVLREPKPDFQVAIQEKDLTIGSGSGQSFTVKTERMDGFEGPVQVEISSLPEGFSVSTPLVIEAGHTEARGTLNARAGAARPSAEAWSNVVVTASAQVSGQPVQRMIGNFGQVKLGEAPKLFVALEPGAAALAQAAATNAAIPSITLAPGQTVPAMLKVRRNGYDELITFAVDNLPHGVIVDNIGLNGVLIPKEASEREIFLTAAKWTPETDRWCFAIESQAGRQTSTPVLIRIRQPGMAAGQTAAR